MSARQRMTTTAVQFNNQDSFQQCILQLMASLKVSSDERTLLENLFNQMDVNNDGRLQPGELKNGLKKLPNFQMSEQELDQLVEKVDLDGDGEINYQEFMTAFADR